MKSPIELAVQFFEYIEAARWTDVGNMLAEDFRYFGPMPDPVDKDTWLDLMESIRNSCPDWAFHVKKISESGNSVNAKIHITGTQTIELDLTPIGMRPVPPTGIHFELPDEDTRLVLKSDKILELHVNPAVHGELMKVLSHLELF
ncbi:MAG: nuclear transport factor 2 family protein [Chlamydiales bacterium]|nr:nuclear transport factor 2 family protein [Chlamydiales bacterium]